MEELGERVKSRREELGLTQTEIARLVGVNQQSIQQLEAGLVRAPRYLLQLGRALGVNVDWLADGKDPKLAPEGPALAGQRKAPVKGIDPSRVRNVDMGAADLPIYASAEGGPSGMTIAFDPIEYVRRPEPLRNVDAAFGMYVVGDSMEPKYRQGDLILIHPTKPARNGDYVLIIKVSDDNTHSALVKQYVRSDDDILTVRQFNPPKDIDIPRHELSGLHLIVGSFETR